MKNIVIMISILTLSVSQGFGQNTDIKALLNNKETKQAIFYAITDNHQLMKDFMQTFNWNEHAIMMMKDENLDMEMMKAGIDHQMMGEKKMMGMMKNNPEMMMNMMSNMMNMCEKDSVMRDKMANMMTDHPEMMQMCMKKMNEKEMIGGRDEKIKMMTPMSPEVKKQHNHK